VTDANVVDSARADAVAAATAAGITIEPVSAPDELDVLRATMESIWGAEIVPPRNLLRGLALGGACLLLARRLTGHAPIGFALGWLGWHDGVHFHSHQVGVAAGGRGGGVGYALKLAQRELCLAHGITEMRWTFDPMLLSNARFNFHRLGAVPVEFIEHCYGDRRDAFNSGERTDRLEVSWRLDDPLSDTPPAVPGAGDGWVDVPADYAALRLADRTAADEARAVVRHGLRNAFDRRAEVLLGQGGYVIRGGAA
jgi:predicted GNAT superfamily acetyltransferase